VKAVLVAMLLAAPGAQAQLYRWVDPQTGSVKFSNAPPAWVREERTGPAVEMIPSPRAQPAKPEAPPKPSAAKPAATAPDPDGPPQAPAGRRGEEPR
jgi:hypothetical protein